MVIAAPLSTAASTIMTTCFFCGAWKSDPMSAAADFLSARDFLLAQRTDYEADLTASTRRTCATTIPKKKEA